VLLMLMLMLMLMLAMITFFAWITTASFFVLPGQLLAPAFLALCVADADVMLMIVISVWAVWAVEDNNVNASKENVTCSSGCGAEPE
jgi:hypothetical protein